MAVAVLAHVSATGTSSAIDTTGATLLVAANGSSSATAPTDSQGNTWILVDSQGGGGFGGVGALYYVNNPSTSATHTFTSGGGLSSVAVIAVSGTDTTAPYETSAKAASKQTAGITPAANGALIVQITGGPLATPVTIDASLTIADFINGAGGVTYGIGLAYYVQPTAGAIAPTWGTGAAPSGSDVGINVLASFKAATGGGGGSRGLFRTPPVSGVGIGGSFFRDPLQAQETMVRRDRIFVPAWLRDAA